MKVKFWVILGLAISSVSVTGCAPVVIAAAGAGAVVIADEVAEQDGDEGLF